MFTTPVRGGKAFAAEQKIRELKTRIPEISAQKLKISRTKIIAASTANMNLRPSRKYDCSKRDRATTFINERFKTIFTMKRMEKIQRL